MQQQLAAQMGACLSRFIRHVGAEHTLPARRFLEDALRGLLVSGDSKLSEWGRSLNEGTRLIYTEKRLSRWIASNNINDADLRKRYLALVKPHLHSQFVAVDGSDIAKPAARKMPNLAWVRDGSSNDPKPVRGWNMLAVDAISASGQRLPLAFHLYSHVDPAFQSEKKELCKVLDEIRHEVPPNAIWLFDRGYDDKGMFELLNERKLRWIVRMQGQRNYFVAGKKYDFNSLVAHVAPSHVYKIRRIRKNLWTCRVGWTAVQLTAYGRGGRVLNSPAPEQFWLVVCSTPAPGHKPLALLTNVPVRSARAAQVIVEGYFGRWAVEEALRFQKQGFQLEDVRVLRWAALRRVLTLALLAFGFLAWQQHRDPGRVAVIIQRVARAFGEVPRFVFYRLQDAVRVLLSRRRRPLSQGPPS